MTKDHHFHQKMESVKQNAAVAIIGSIRGSSREKLLKSIITFGFLATCIGNFAIF